MNRPQRSAVATADTPQQSPAPQKRVEHIGFAIIPRVVIRGRKHLKKVDPTVKDMTFTDLGLYTCLKDICGDEGECTYTLENLALVLGCGSDSTISRHIPILVGHGLIRAEKKSGVRGHENWHISIINKWPENDALYSNKKHLELVPPSSSRPKSVSNCNASVSNCNASVSNCNDDQSTQAQDHFNLTGKGERGMNNLNEEEPGEEEAPTTENEETPESSSSSLSSVSFSEEVVRPQEEMVRAKTGLEASPALASLIAFYANFPGFNLDASIEESVDFYRTNYPKKVITITWLKKNVATKFGWYQQDLEKRAPRTLSVPQTIPESTTPTKILAREWWMEHYALWCPDVNDTKFQQWIKMPSDHAGYMDLTYSINWEWIPRAEARKLGWKTSRVFPDGMQRDLLNHLRVERGREDLYAKVEGPESKKMIENVYE